MDSSSDPIVVTGAYGFVGANICKYLLERGCQVVALEGPQRTDWRLSEHPLLQRRQVDITSAADIAALFGETQPAAIINCAAYGAYSNQADPALIYDVNFHGVQLMLEAARHCHGLRAFIQLGSSSEYGTNCRAPGEGDPTWPDSHYAVSKVSASALVRFYALKYAMPAFVLRLYSVYGPLEDASRLIPVLLSRAQMGRLPPLAHPSISRDFIYVEDVCRAVKAVIDQAPQLQKGDYFNVGSGVCTKLGDLIELACELFPMQEAPKWGSMPARHWDHPDWYADPSHAASTLGWSAQTSLRDGLLRTMSFMQINPEVMMAAEAHTVTARA